MHLSLEQFEKIIQRKLKHNQILLAASVLIALVLFVIQNENVLWSIYFLLIGALSLPNINRCKSDRKTFNEKNFEVSRGTVLDLFPETENGTNWIIFVDDPSSNKAKVTEFVVPAKPEVNVGDSVIIHFTPKMNIPVAVRSEIHAQDKEAFVM